MTKYNHDGKRLHDTVGITEEEYIETGDRVVEELRDMVSKSKVSTVAEAIEIWLENGADLDKAVKYLILARIALRVGMV